MALREVQGDATRRDHYHCIGARERLSVSGTSASEADMRR